MRESPNRLRDRAEQAERKWLRADALLCETGAVARAAQHCYQQGDEGEASLLVDVVARLAALYETET